MAATSSLKEFSFKELKMATGNFSSDAWLGDGDLCKVYKGWMDEKTLAPSKSGEGMVVAVKEYRKREPHFELWGRDNEPLAFAKDPWPNSWLGMGKPVCYHTKPDPVGHDPTSHHLNAPTWVTSPRD
ncbi:hypothetical protein LWI29_018733 [Acer saccharum]|uniref:Uncharacterized protein n=1 Tax=Acer saccharum TaxID=4024 RepID=A0AA39W5T7_ACESA|nr:hypothetical protein LWI29_018733 [Acer saccharum]